MKREKVRPPDSLTRLVRSRSSYAKNSFESQLARYAENNPCGFENAVGKLNGKPGGSVGRGGKSWFIKLLPKISVQLIFYAGDDEFPPEAKILFDISAVDFLEFECLAVLATIFVREIIDKSGNSEN